MQNFCVESMYYIKIDWNQKKSIKKNMQNRIFWREKFFNIKIVLRDQIGFLLDSHVFFFSIFKIFEGIRRIKETIC